MSTLSTEQIRVFREPVSLARVREVLDYNELTGVLTRKLRGGRLDVGAVAGTTNHPHGYIRVRIDGIFHYAHRIAWAYVHGEWPDRYIDHINGIRSDNRISNLRIATREQNAQNLPMPRNNTSGHVGVFKDRKRWRARISKHDKMVNLGSFDTKEEAATAYEAAKQQYHQFCPTIRVTGWLPPPPSATKGEGEVPLCASCGKRKEKCDGC